VRALDRGRHLRAKDEAAPALIERLVLRLSRLASASKTQLSLVGASDLSALGRRTTAVAGGRSGSVEADLHVHRDQRSAMRLVSLLGLNFLALIRR